MLLLFSNFFFVFKGNCGNFNQCHMDIYWDLNGNYWTGGYTFIFLLYSTKDFKRNIRSSLFFSQYSRISKEYTLHGRTENEPLFFFWYFAKQILNFFFTHWWSLSEYFTTSYLHIVFKKFRKEDIALLCTNKIWSVVGGVHWVWEMVCEVNVLYSVTLII